MAYDRSVVTNDAVLEVLRAWAIEGRVLFGQKELQYECLSGDGMISLRIEHARHLGVADVLRELDGQAIDTEAGPFTLTRRPKLGSQAWALLSGVHTPAQLAGRELVRAWYVTVGNADMWVATAKGRTEAKRLALVEVAQNGLVPTRKTPGAQRARYNDQQAWELGEGTVWGFED